MNNNAVVYYRNSKGDWLAHLPTFGGPDSVWLSHYYGSWSQMRDEMSGYARRGYPVAMRY